jgi:flavin-dependent dehydrogenase
MFCSKMKTRIGGELRLDDKKTILIIGGGPAGTSAAIWAAKFGLSVILIDSERFPRNRPGETLHPGVERLFDQLGVNEDIQAAKFIRHRGIWIRWTNNLSRESNINTSASDDWKLLTFGKDEKGPWLGYQAWRATLDNILLRRAERCGVRVLQPCHALDVILDDNNSSKVIGLKTSCGNFMADFVIDATGPIHWLARRLKLTIKKCSPPLFAYYGYARGECSSLREEPAITVTPEGWIWTAKIRKQLYQWTRLHFNHDQNNNKNHNSILPYDWLPDEFKGLRPVQSIRGSDVTWRLVVQAAGLGYFIVGDAAAVIDPSSSHGVLRALISGMMASHSILRIVRDRIPTVSAINGYNYWIAKWFFYDVTKLKELKRFHLLNSK